MCVVGGLWSSPQRSPTSSVIADGEEEFILKPFEIRQMFQDILDRQGTVSMTYLKCLLTYYHTFPIKMW